MASQPQTPAPAKVPVHVAIVMDGKRRVVRAPYSLEGIDIGAGVAGRIEVAMPGFRKAAQDFALTSAQPSFVRRIDPAREAEARLSVQAVPWGIVDVAGVVSGRETPVGSVKLRAGSYSVSVRHPPTGRVLQARIAVADGQSRRCIAVFDESPRMSCR